ncbi:MAG: hypothetical protein IJP82_04990 [Bacteroidaceae bacterium]|nr:hypothetical protein [Bacteroidaceae bacterium]
MDRDRLLGYVEIVGEMLVLIGAVAWLPLRASAAWIFAVGVVLFAIGRFSQTPFYQKYSVHDPKELTLRRLYHQRVFGMVALILSAAMMFLPVGFYYGMYVGASSWLILFVIFVVIEVYSVFRISAIEKT